MIDLKHELDVFAACIKKAKVKLVVIKESLDNDSCPDEEVARGYQEALNEVFSAHANLVEGIEKQTGNKPECKPSLIEYEKLVESIKKDVLIKEYEENLEKLVLFTRVSSDIKKYDDFLTAHREYAKELIDVIKTKKLPDNIEDFNVRIKGYTDFVEFVVAGPANASDEQVECINEIFSAEAFIGLYRNSYKISEEPSPAEPIPPPDTDDNDIPEKLDEPITLKEDFELVEEPIKESGEEALLVKYNIVLPAARDSNELIMTRPRKTPKSATAFINDVRSKTKEFNFVVELLRLQFLENLVTHVPSATRILPEDIIGIVPDVINYYEKEGFLYRCHIQNDPDYVMYSLTNDGQMILQKEKVNKTFHFSPKDITFQRDEISVEDFLRYKEKYEWNNLWKGQESIVDKELGIESECKYGFLSINRLFAFTVRLEDTEVFVFPAVVSQSEKEDIEIFLTEFKASLDEATTNIKKIHVVVSGIDAEKWMLLIKEENFGIDAAYYFANLEEKTIVDTSGESYQIENWIADIIQNNTEYDLISSREEENIDLDPEEYAGIKPEALPETDPQEDTKTEDDPNVGPEIVSTEDSPWAIAKKIAECNEEPDEASVDKLIDMLLYGDFSPDNEIDESGYLPEEWTYAHALSQAYSISLNEEVSKKYRTKSLQMQMALELTKKDILYTSEKIAQAFPEEEDFEPLRIATLIRAMFAPDAEYELGVYQQGEAFQKNNSSVFNSYSKRLRSVFESLVGIGDFMKKNNFSFNLNLWTNYIDEGEKDSELINIKKEAENKRKYYATNVSLREVKNLEKKCFGEGSEMDNCLAILQKNDYRKIAVVRDYFTKIDKDDGVTKEIESMRKEIGKSNRNIKNLVPKYIDAIKSNYKERRELINRWLLLNNDDNSDIKKEMIRPLRSALLENIPPCIDEIMESKEKGSRIIANSLCRILNALQTGSLVKIKGSPGFLKGYWIQLDADNYPIITFANEDELVEIPGYETWRNVAHHISEKCDTYQQSLDKILDTENPESYYFDNVGAGEAIDKLLSSYGYTEHAGRNWNHLKIAEKRIQYCEDVFKEFKGELGLALSEKRIDLQTQNKLRDLGSLNIGEANENIAFKNKNYGSYRYMLKVLRNIVEVEGNNKKAQFLNILEKKDIECEIVTEIKNALNDNNLALAEHYLSRLEKGDTELSAEEKGEIRDNDLFKEFRDSYKELHKICESNKDEPLKIWGFEEIQDSNLWKLKTKEWAADNKNESKDLLAAWPEKKDLDWVRNNSTDNKKVDELIPLLKALNFGDSLQVTVSNKVNRELLFQMKNIDRPRFDLQDYDHPIADFGTKMPDPKDFLFMFDYSTPEVIIDRITKLNLGELTIVFVDWNLTLDAKREIVSKFMTETQRQNSFLLIDRVLLMYLATIEKKSRVPALLRCTLPFTFIQPFTPDYAPKLSDEMFFGRRSELEDLSDMSVSNIVYGGRQLGKSALLKRIKSVQHKPDKKEYAVWVDIDQKGIKASAEEISKELFNEGIIKSKYKTFDSIFDELEKQFKSKDGIKKLILLIDEADDFLEEAKEEKYSVLHRFMNLQNKEEFKFVLAGLHNVAVASKDNFISNDNSVKIRPICISPLSHADAIRLLQRPLSFLGFTNPPNDLHSIIVDTNYYPGILQEVGRTLVKKVAENFREYCSVKENPPYDLNKQKLRKILPWEILQDLIKDKLMITLGVDKRYLLLARIMAYLFYNKTESGMGSSFMRAFSFEDVYDEYKEYSGLQPDGLNNMSAAQVKAYLDEMVEMGIFWSKEEKVKKGKTIQVVKKYWFFTERFVNMLGTIDQIENDILNISSQ